MHSVNRLDRSHATDLIVDFDSHLWSAYNLHSEWHLDSHLLLCFSREEEGLSFGVVDERFWPVPDLPKDANLLDVLLCCDVESDVIEHTLNYLVITVCGHRRSHLAHLTR